MGDLDALPRRIQRKISVATFRYLRDCFDAWRFRRRYREALLLYRESQSTIHAAHRRIAAMIDDRYELRAKSQPTVMDVALGRRPDLELESKILFMDPDYERKRKEKS